MRYQKVFFAVLLLSLLSLTGCKKYLEIPLPVNDVAASGAYANNASASAVVTNIYTSLLNLRGPFQGNASCINFCAGLYADERIGLAGNIHSTTNTLAFYTNMLTESIGGADWILLYKQLYTVNLVIEGVTPTQLTMRSQLLGESYFLRAFFHFYLTNLYGAIPIATTSAYKTNNNLMRSPQAEVYRQIIADLKQAQTLLDNNYRDYNGAITINRGRPNRMAATALLARVYLYAGDWANAGSQADSLIGATAVYQLAPAAETFLAGSKEAIWGMQPMPPLNTVQDAATYIISPGLTPEESGIDSYLSPSLVNAFDSGDARFLNWVGVSVVPADSGQPAASYYYAYKYKTKATVPDAAEYLMMLRLGEQYLIRAEARAQQGDITGAGEDLNTLRVRAGLGPTTASSQGEMLTVLLHERQVELFAEHGHRFFDLRRTGNLDAVMNAIAASKGSVWHSFAQWWPIPHGDIVANPKLTQTPGY